MHLINIITAAVAAVPIAVSAVGTMGYAIGVKKPGIQPFWPCVPDVSKV
jgi:hypothetical protein